MARKDTKKPKAGTEDDIQPETWLIPDDEHPDYVWGQIEGASDETGDASGIPGIPRPEPFPGPFPFPDPPRPGPQIPPILPRPFPIPQPPIRPLPIRFCTAISGTYTDASPSTLPDRLPGPIAYPRPLPFRPLPLRLVTHKVRVDVDRFFPQMRISLEVNRLIPRGHAHAIAEVTSDQCLGWNRRRITARIIYRDGSAGLIPGSTVVFEAQGSFRGYTSWSVTLSDAGVTKATWPLKFSSQYFDPFEFEVDRVSNADVPTTTYDTASHPNRPATLPAEVLSIANVYQRAGFDAKTSPNSSVIPVSGAGANGTWSDAEMHNAMITYWSRFADRPQWAMWVLFANQHDIGYSLGGIMFDDIGPNHRQGTAIFTNSFIQDAPASDPDAAAWRRRMVFWTAVHEMGHGFNLAHSWQKALSIGGDTGPWIPQADRPEARSFMNYPFRVGGGESTFFADFAFRFDDQELQFMRHAPRRFVQMGNANWFVDHAFEAPPPEMEATGWELAIRPNREVNEYDFLEPVRLELKLTNITETAQMVDADLLADADNIEIFVGRAGGHTRRHNAFIRHLEIPETVTVEPGQSLYAAHLVGASTSEWLIDEAGFYKVQAAVMVNGLPVLSNVLRLFVAPPKSDEESRLAPDYFTPEVARALAFDGAPALENAMDTLREVADRCPKHPAARHAQVAISAQDLRDFKYLDTDGKDGMDLRSTSAQVEKAAKTQMDALADAPEEAAKTLGHIDYFDDLERLADALANEGDKDGAVKVLKLAVSTMKKRGVIERVITETSTKLAAIK